MKIHIVAVLFGMCLCVALAGCGEKAASSSDVTAAELTSSEESITEGVSETADSQSANHVSNIKFYEITENNFQDGLYYNFSEDEVAEWKNLISSGELVSQGGELAKEDTKYMIELYDSSDANIGYYRVDEDLNLYSEDGNRLTSDKITEMLSEIIQTSELQ